MRNRGKPCNPHQVSPAIAASCDQRRPERRTPISGGGIRLGFIDDQTRSGETRYCAPPSDTQRCPSRLDHKGVDPQRNKHASAYRAKPRRRSDNAVAHGSRFGTSSAELKRYSPDPQLPKLPAATSTNAWCSCGRPSSKSDTILSGKFATRPGLVADRPADARVSTTDQDLSIQETALRAAGCEVRAEKRSGTTTVGASNCAPYLTFYTRGTC
jgi:hypothetical protein